MRVLGTVVFCLLPIPVMAASTGEIVQTNTRSIVFLEVRDDQGKFVESGTGFIVSHDGYVVTAAHIKVDEPNGHKLWAVVGQREGTAYPLTRRDQDETADVALWQFPQSPVCRNAAAIASKVPTVDDRIVSLGFPGTSGLTHNVLSINNFQTSRGFYRTDGFLEPGNSGGPVFDPEGNVVAIVHGGGQPGTENNEIIPIALAKPLLQKWNVAFGMDEAPPAPDTCYATCRRPEHGIEKWTNETNWVKESGWMGGGNNPRDICTGLANVALRELQGDTVDVEPLPEKSKKDFLGRVEYKYPCRGIVRSGAIYVEKQTAACGFWN